MKKKILLCILATSLTVCTAALFSACQTQQSEHVHSYATEWSQDETHHWHASTCEHEVISDKAAHTWDNGTVTTAATHTTDGVMTYTCTICGYERTEDIPAKVDDHTYSTEWSQDELYHWHASTCEHEVISDKAAHTWDNGTVTTAATHTTNGVMTYTCTTCGFERMQSIPAKTNEHTYSTEWSQNEIYHWHASTCEHEVISDNAAHTWDNGTVTTAATHTTDGVMTYTCTTCGFERMQSIPAKTNEHTYSTEWSQDELYHWHASTCEHELIIDKAMHTWDNGTVTNSATQTAEGIITYTCTTCGYERKESIPAEFEVGDGSESNPYMISTINQLVNVANYPTAHFKLQNDITIQSVKYGNYNFTPMFSDENMFNGVFDGNGHKIINLTINNTSTYYTGLFACIGRSGVVKNLSLENVNIRGTNYVGGIAGYSLGEITDCKVSGNINYLDENNYMVFIGGVVGRIENLICGCSTDVTITCIASKAATYIGGIAGYHSSVTSSYAISEISDCSFVGDIVCDKASERIYVGGIFGYVNDRIKCTRLRSNSELTITESYYAYCGGLVGFIGNYGYNCIIIDSYFTGNLSVNSSNAVYCGGLAGYTDTPCTIRDSYSTGKIIANSSSTVYCGGLAGEAYCNIFDSYATSNIIANSSSTVYCGGLVGRSYNYGNISDSYFTGNLTANSLNYLYCGGLAGEAAALDCTIIDSYTTGNITVSGLNLYCGGFTGRSSTINITSSYTVCKIDDTCEGQIYKGAFIGYAYEFTLTNSHWLYYAESSVEYAVGYGGSIGLPSSIGATKHTVLEDFYTLDETLNKGLEEPVWENLGETALPTLKPKNEEQN